MTETVIRILGLDDDPDMHLLIKEDFKRNGILNPCEFHINKKDFFDHFTEDTHVAIVDHYLGGTSVGFEVVDEINKRVQASRTRKAGCQIIVVSGQKNYNVLKRYNRMGVFDYIDKGEEDENGKDIFSELLIQSTKNALELSRHWLRYYTKWENGISNNL